VSVAASASYQNHQPRISWRNWPEHLPPGTVQSAHKLTTVLRAG